MKPLMFRSLTVGVMTLTLLALTHSTAEAVAPAKTKNRYVSNRAVRITYVVPHSAAEEAGLEAEDLIVSINGTKITSITHLQQALAATAGNAHMEVINHRDGETVYLTAYPRMNKLGINCDVVEYDPVAPYTIATSSPYSSKAKSKVTTNSTSKSKLKVRPIK